MKIGTTTTVHITEADMAECVAYALKHKHNLNVDVEDVKRKLACSSSFTFFFIKIDL